MAFIPPSFAELTKATGTLDYQFSTALGRLEISLPCLLAQVEQKVIHGASERNKDKEFFDILTMELKNSLNEQDEEKKKSATLLLLGALEYCYFRLQKTYKKSYFSNINHCRLFKGLNHILSTINDHDRLTVSHALNYFRANMLQLNPHQEKPRYMHYAYLAEDKKFTQHIDEVIARYERKHELFLKLCGRQFKAIAFIQSLAQCLVLEQQQMANFLCKGLAHLNQKYPFFKGADLKPQVLEEGLLNAIDEPYFKEKISRLLRTDFIQSNWQEVNYINFESKMQRCASSLAGYTLFGGYVLMLEQEELSDKLKNCVYSAMGVQNEHLLKEEKLSTLQFLQQFIHQLPTTYPTQISSEFFAGDEQMKNELNLQLNIFSSGSCFNFN